MKTTSNNGFTVNYTLRHSGYSVDVYWSADPDEALEYAQRIYDLFRKTHLIVVWNNNDLEDDARVGLVVQAS